MRAWRPVIGTCLAAGVSALLLADARPAGTGQREALAVPLKGIDNGSLQTIPVSALTRAARPLDLGAYAIKEPRPDGRPYEPGRLVVKFEASATPTEKTAARAAVGARTAEEPPWADFEVIAVDAARDPVEASADLMRHAGVAWAQPAYRIQPLFTPNDPAFAQQWNLAMLDMARAWDINRGAAGDVVVAVIDSGIAWRDQIIRYTTVPLTWPDGTVGRRQVDLPFAAAPDLAGPNRFVAPHDFNWNDDNPADLDGHGTHVAGTIGQLTDNGTGLAGMAFNVRLMPVKVIPSSWEQDLFGVPIAATDPVVAQAIRYAADNGARVINLSLGRSGPESPVMEEALRYAVQRGAFVAIAGGNEFERNNPVSTPARYAPAIDGVMAVAAVDRSRARAYYSNTGAYIEIAAPGGDVRVGGLSGLVLQQSYDPAYAEATFPPRFDVFVNLPSQGTSIAAPHVAGLAALLVHQGLRDPGAIEAAIKRFALDLGPAGRDDDFGYGLIQPRETLRGLGLAR